MMAVLNSVASENVTVESVQTAGATNYTEAELAAIGRLRLNFQMSGVTGVEIESVDGFTIAGEAAIENGAIVGEVENASTTIRCNAPAAEGFIPGEDYYLYALPQNVYWGYRLTVYRNGLKADTYNVHQMFEAGVTIAPENLNESELVFEALDAPLVEEERPELDQKTKDLLRAYRKDPSEANYQALYDQMAVRYDRTTARKKAKLRELEREAGQDKIDEMVEIVDEMVDNRDLRIRQRFMSLIDDRKDDDPNDEWLVVRGTDPADDVYIGYAPVTNAEWAAFKSDFTYADGKDNYPVVGITVSDANAYCNWLIERDAQQHTFRLPTDEEWLLAAGHMPKDVLMNAGHTQSGLTAVDAYADHPGGNGGIDYWGNCWEWTCSKDEQGRYIIKGGAWDSDRTDCRSEKSDVVRNPTMGYQNVGFRVARTVYTGMNETDIEGPATSDIIEAGGAEFAALSAGLAGTELPYREARIDYAADQKAALIIYLHGGTGNGNDNTTQMDTLNIANIAAYLDAHNMNSIMLVPQCPVGKQWGSAMNEVIKALADQYVAEGQVNADRIYLFGSSMGGRGVVSLSAAYPGFFAAVMDVAGNPKGLRTRNVARSPLLAVVGTADDITSSDAMQEFVETVQSYGGTARIDILDGLTHEETLLTAYTDERLEWVFANGKQTSGIDSLHADNIANSNEIYNLRGQRLTQLQRGLNIVNGRKIFLK